MFPHNSNFNQLTQITPTLKCLISNNISSTYIASVLLYLWHLVTKYGLEIAMMKNVPHQMPLKYSFSGIEVHMYLCEIQRHSLKDKIKSGYNSECLWPSNNLWEFVASFYHIIYCLVEENFGEVGYSPNVTLQILTISHVIQIVTQNDDLEVVSTCSKAFVLWFAGFKLRSLFLRLPFSAM